MCEGEGATGYGNPPAPGTLVRSEQSTSTWRKTPRVCSSSFFSTNGPLFSLECLRSFVASRFYTSENYATRTKKKMWITIILHPYVHFNHLLPEPRA